MRKIFLVLICLSLAGCETTKVDTGVKWYNPKTWFSGSAGRTSAQLGAEILDANAKAVRAARDSVHKTAVALAKAPASRATSVATDFNAQAQTLLDQVAGPPTAQELADMREQVRLLTSDIAEERTAGEKLKQAQDGLIATLSNRLSDLAAAKASADKQLAAAFDRENAMANEFRNQQWWSWFWRISLGTLALLCLAGWVYARYVLGGMPNAVGGLLASLERKNPAAATDARSILDDILHSKPDVLAAIAAARVKAS